MKKYLITLLSLLIALSTYVILISSFKKKKQRVNCETKPINYGMRVIENPFEEVINQQEIKPTDDIIVVNNNYNLWKVYKSDILYLSGVFVVCVLVILVSVFANKSRVASDKIEQNKNEQVELSVIHSLRSIEETTINLTEEVDSLNTHIEARHQNEQEMLNRQPQAQQGERKMK